MNWDLYWRFEAFRRACDPLDFRKWKRDSQRALRGLYPGPDVRLLDATAGMGDHTVNLAEEGFVVECTDESPRARAMTRAALDEAGLQVPVHDVRWQDLGDAMPGRFDLIFNDALHWTYDEEEMRAALRGTLGALRPGGALVFFFADARKPAEDSGRRLLELEWGPKSAPRLGWSHATPQCEVTLTLHATKGSDHIDEHHVYLERDLESGAVQPSVLTMRHVYRWDWFHLVPMLEEAGFVDVRSDVFPNVAKGYDFAMNRAFRPA